MRGNGGGSPISVIDFMCMIGNDRTLEAINNYNISIREWPVIFDVDGESIHSSDLEVLNNKTLQLIDPNFYVSFGNMQPYRDYNLTSLVRANLSLKSCTDMRSAIAAKHKWIIMTNGREFSAAEDFLFLAKKSGNLFKIMGQPSMGGAGNPSWISLPKTKTGLRLSTARYLVDSKEVIEKIGVQPDEIISVIETEQQFEERTKGMSYDSWNLNELKKDFPSELLNNVLKEKDYE